MKTADIRITPVAVEDMPLLNTKGVHGSHYLRSIIEVECDDGTVGLGETYGGQTEVPLSTNLVAVEFPHGCRPGAERSRRSTSRLPVRHIGAQR